LWLDDHDEAASDSPRIVKIKYNKNKDLVVINIECGNGLGNVLIVEIWVQPTAIASVAILTVFYMWLPT
jgi:hypothetical protein